MSRETVHIDLVETDTDPDLAPADAPTVSGADAAPDVVNEDAADLDALPAHATANADGSVTLPLLYPRELFIQTNGRVRSNRYEKLTFHRLTGADQRAIAAARDDMMSVVAFARSTKLSQAVMNALFDRMDAADIAAGGRVLNSFFASGRKTGK